jgi:hypothetical protein
MVREGVKLQRTFNQDGVDIVHFPFFLRVIANQSGSWQGRPASRGPYNPEINLNCG